MGLSFAKAESGNMNANRNYYRCQGSLRCHGEIDQMEKDSFIKGSWMYKNL
jgi:hypothetical protein